MATSYTYSTREMEIILRKNGYRHLRTKGSHRVYSNGIHTTVLTLDVNKITAIKMIKKCGLMV